MAANLTNVASTFVDLQFAELICGPPTFVNIAPQNCDMRVDGEQGAGGVPVSLPERGAGRPEQPRSARRVRQVNSWQHMVSY